MSQIRGREFGKGEATDFGGRRRRKLAADKVTNFEWLARVAAKGRAAGRGWVTMLRWVTKGWQRVPDHDFRQPHARR